MGRPPSIRSHAQILFLRYHIAGFRSAVLERVGTDMAFRWFWVWASMIRSPITPLYPLPPGIGQERFTQVFQDLVGQAREFGFLVRDRLRLKDATPHLPRHQRRAALGLVAQVRRSVLQAAKPLFQTGSRRATKLERFATTRECPTTNAWSHVWKGAGHDHRFARQLRICRHIGTASQRQRLERAGRWRPSERRSRSMEPRTGLISGVDDDARLASTATIFAAFAGFAMDPDSGDHHAVNVLPGNGAEAADAIHLIARKSSAAERRGGTVDGRSRL